MNAHYADHPTGQRSSSVERLYPTYHLLSCSAPRQLELLFCQSIQRPECCVVRCTASILDAEPRKIRCGSYCSKPHLSSEESRLYLSPRAFRGHEKHQPYLMRALVAIYHRTTSHLTTWQPVPLLRFSLIARSLYPVQKRFIICLRCLLAVIGT